MTILIIVAILAAMAGGTVGAMTMAVLAMASNR
jgi:hypothetical protein